MGRWEPNARDRLARAAVELFSQQGFANTTVPQITHRAGLTTRSFYRHFTDKREVLFAVEDEFPEVVAQVMAQVPTTLSPRATLERAAEIVATTRFEGLRAFLQTRRAIIATDHGLRERALEKYAALSAVVSREFTHRGLDQLSATLSAQVLVTVLTLSLDRWLDQHQHQPTLNALMNKTFNALWAIAADDR
ncbi:MAG: TetR/AcrR family transcriptional regulator [Candidatus Dormibacteraeota bacterium]|nr:TetR/AcrR family transcriptional regulator [Candidatus Dormibacteraeota bacterium]